MQVLNFNFKMKVSMFVSLSGKLLLLNMRMFFSVTVTHFSYLLPDMVEPQMLKLFNKASSIVLANVTTDVFDDLDEVEVNILLVPG